MLERGVPILKKTIKIIKYFKPKYHFIENPKSGQMKDFLKAPHYDVDYCRYADWGYRKSTRIWTNKKGFEAKVCNKKCGNMNGTTHKINLGGGGTSLQDRYRIPPKLIESLFEGI